MIQYLAISALAILCLDLVTRGLVRSDMDATQVRVTYLLGMVTAALTPLLVMWVPSGMYAVEGLIDLTIPVVSVSEVFQVDTATRPVWLSWLPVVYISGMVWMSVRRMISYRRLRRQIASGDQPVSLSSGARMYRSRVFQVPFSFMDNIVLPAHIRTESEEGQMILAHEQAHIRLRHHWDNLFMVMASLVWWFHPSVFAVHRRLRQHHEFEVDAYMLGSVNSYSYASLLLSYHLPQKSPAWVSAFSKSVTEKRLYMISESTKMKSQRGRMLLVLLAVSLTAGMMSCNESLTHDESEIMAMAETGKDTGISGPTDAGTQANVAESDPEVYQVVEQMPRFPGCEDTGLEGQELHQCGMKKLVAYISENLIYPKQSGNGKVEGISVIQFVIDEQGDIGNVTVVKSLGAEFDAASVRVLEKMKEEGIQWIPGEHGGKKVKVRLALPIKFQMN